MIPAELACLGVPVVGVALSDGSGLAPANRVTCAALLGVIALGSQPRFSSILSGLAIAGQSGTLAGRFVGTSLVGRLRAKTGHIDGVVGLAGFIAPPAHGDASSTRFAFVANGGFSTLGGEDLQDQVGELIGGYADAPSVPNPLPAPRE